MDVTSRAAAGKAQKLSELTALNVGHCGMPRCQNSGALGSKSEPTGLWRFRHVRLCAQPPALFPARPSPGLRARMFHPEQLRAGGAPQGAHPCGRR